MQYFRDEYLEQLTATDKPYFLRETTEQNALLNYLTQLALNAKLNNNTSYVALVLDQTGNDIILAVRIKNPQNIQKSAQYENTKTAVTSLKSLGLGTAIFDSSKSNNTQQANQGPRVLVYSDAVHQILTQNGWAYNDKSIDSAGWLYANSTVSKSWGKNWGSEVMTSIGNALGTQGDTSWVGTGKR
jgi:hypothetical protein